MSTGLPGLTPAQAQAEADFQAFTTREIAPSVERLAAAEEMCPKLLGRVAEEGYFGLTLPPAYGGKGADMVTYGLLHRRVGMTWASLLNILTAHTAVAQALWRWGRNDFKQEFLPAIAFGRSIATLCLTEPRVGSAAQSVETEARSADGGFVLSGEKQWITAGQTAGVYLTFARADEEVCAFLVDRDSPGVSVTPIKGMLGMRAAMLARITFDQCFVSGDRLVGAAGFGFSHVAGAALNLGR